jgi:3-hydroxy-9,10-secoandrosta-1,3,5(10)-triene-9,17-dione monooxygenase reductase component
VTIHMGDPFAVPEGERGVGRRLRGRVSAGVTLWTAGSGAERAGLTVSSMMVADGDPVRLLGLLDAESEVWTAIESSGFFTVAPLRTQDRQLAEKFAGAMPAPGGTFRGYDWTSTRFGPVLAGLHTWAGCRLDAARPMGWALLIEATVETVEIGADDEGAPLVHYRGRYRDVA